MRRHVGSNEQGMAIKCRDMIKCRIASNGVVAWPGQIEDYTVLRCDFCFLSRSSFAVCLLRSFPFPTSFFFVGPVPVCTVRPFVSTTGAGRPLLRFSAILASLSGTVHCSEPLSFYLLLLSLLDSSSPTSFDPSATFCSRTPSEILTNINHGIL